VCVETSPRIKGMEKHADAKLVPKTGSSNKDTSYCELTRESFSHALSLDSDELKLELLTCDRFTLPPSTEVFDDHEEEDGSEFIDSFDRWLRFFYDWGFEELDEASTFRSELTLSPSVIRAPLRSVCADKRARISE
jgi:hypothetical protein